MCLNNRQLTAWFILTLLYSQYGFAQCTLSGLVDNNGVPLAGAKISVSNDNVLLTSAITLADGRFKIDYAEPARSAPTVKVVVIASGYADDGRNLLRNPQQKCPNADDMHFSLAMDDSGAASNSAPTFTIYVSPFELYGGDNDQQAQEFNADLPNFIFHKIMAYKSSLGLDANVSDMSINTLEEKLSPAKGSEIRNLGHQLGALAMVVGEVEILPGNQSGLELMSSVKPIPVFENLEINTFVINDKLPAGSLRPSKVGRQLSDHWGKQAVLAYVMQSLAIHQGPWQKTELDNMEKILISVRSTIRDESDPFKSMIDELLIVVKGKRL
jgi:hypothetical protein